ncbi:MAG TPA: formate dehydrogenase subunit delta [Burkholderiales bacterium]|nr:formate dehydrogenase subunit delta [Burkholderiales bacterium]
MEAHKLVKMANEIAAFFHAEPDQAVAIEGVASHLKRFWDPRMRRELVRWMDEHDGEGLTELAAAAIKTNRDRLLPAKNGG